MKRRVSVSISFRFPCFLPELKHCYKLSRNNSTTVSHCCWNINVNLLKQRPLSFSQKSLGFGLPAVTLCYAGPCSARAPPWLEVGSLSWEIVCFSCIMIWSYFNFRATSAFEMIYGFFLSSEVKCMFYGKQGLFCPFISLSIVSSHDFLVIGRAIIGSEQWVSQLMARSGQLTCLEQQVTR